MLRYTGDFKASLWQIHLFHYGFSTASNRQCEVLPSFHLSGLIYDCTNYCDILCSDILTLPRYCHDLPPQIREIKALLRCETRSKSTTLWSDIMPNFLTGEASTNMGKHQFHQVHNLKYILLFSTILAVFGPLHLLTWIKRQSRQLKTEPSHSAHYHVPADCEMWLSAALQLFYCHSHVKGCLHQVPLVRIFCHFTHKSPIESKCTWWRRKAVERSSFGLIHSFAEASRGV